MSTATPQRPLGTADSSTLLAGLIREAETVAREHHGEPVETTDRVWRETPVPFVEFVTSPEHLNLPPLFPRQEAAVSALLGNDPTRIFDEPSPPTTVPLEWTTCPRSSNVKAWAYDRDQRLLYVQFRSGRERGSTYRYDQVPAVEVDGLAHADSPGKWLAGHIKPRFRAAKVKGDPADLVAHVRQAAAREHQIAVLLWGKGSGKDYISSIVVCYLIYVLLCLQDPQGHFDLAPGEPIDILNVAYNADQAKRVFFEKLKQRFFRWRWLRENFDLIEAGRRKYPDAAGRPKVELNDGEVLFPRQIRCFSKHSENESYEGLNVIAWVMDEASAFLSKLKKENAGRIYQTLRTSAASRFQRRWIGFIISYPRHGDDFTMQKVAEARANPGAGLYADGPASTWEVNRNLGRGEFVEVRPGHHVPVELANDYLLDFEEALAKYECSPPAAKDALIKQPERLWQAVQRGRQPLIEWEPVTITRSVVDGDGQDTDRRFAAIKLTRLGKLPKGAKLFLHGDPARTSDAFAIGIGHGVPATVIAHVPAIEVLTQAQIDQANAAEQARAKREKRDARLLDADTLVPWERDVVRTVIDALLVWRPDPRNDVQVDLLNVREVLLQLVGHYGRGAFGAVTFDQYDSAETVQLLATKKLPVDNEQWSNPFQHRIYRGFRSALYNDLVTFPDHPTITSEDPLAPGAIYELTRVEEVEGHKIDHPEGGSKDLADAIVRVVEHVTGQVRNAFSFGQVKPTTQHTPPLEGGSPKVDPKRTPSPATQAMRDADRARRERRPEGELEPATGTVRTAGRLSFGKAGG